MTREQKGFTALTEQSIGAVAGTKPHRANIVGIASLRTYLISVQENRGFRRAVFLYFILALLIGAWAMNATVQTSPVYMLSYSIDSSRANGVALNGTANLTGSVYIFTAPSGSPTNFNPPNIASVSYWLDNPTMTGAATHIEHNTPYDFQNGSVTNANPWNASNVAKGQHTITQQVILTNGTTEIDTATFTTGAPPQTIPLSMSFPGSGVGKGFTLTVNQVVVPSCTQAIDGDCFLAIQISMPPGAFCATDSTGATTCTAAAGTLSIIKTATLPAPQATTTVIATVTAGS